MYYQRPTNIFSSVIFHRILDCWHGWYLTSIYFLSFLPNPIKLHHNVPQLQQKLNQKINLKCQTVLVGCLEIKLLLTLGLSWLWIQHQIGFVADLDLHSCASNFVSALADLNTYIFKVCICFALLERCCCLCVWAECTKY